MFKVLLLLATLLAGFVFLREEQGEQVIEHQEERENQILQSQHKVLQDAKKLEYKMSEDLEQRMQPSN